MNNKMINTEVTFPRILVVGDLMLDCSLRGVCDRISPEAPVQIVEIDKETYTLGGAGNVVNNLLALDSKVTVVSVLGNDDAANIVLNLLGEKGISTECVFRENGRKTTQKNRIIVSHQQVLRFDREDKQYISKEIGLKIIDSVKKNIDDIDIILLSNYEKGVLSSFLTRRIIDLANKHNKKVLVDPKTAFKKFRNAFLIKPNKHEACLETGIQIKDDVSLEKAGFALRKNLNVDYIIITLGEEGMAVFGEKMIKIYSRVREVYDVTGAGDTVLSALGFFIAMGKTIKEAAHFANSAAAVVIEKMGTAVATLGEIMDFEKKINHTTDYKIKDINEIKEIVMIERKNKSTIVFTNGCFDLLHVGHVKYLQKVKSLGDLLIVGLNSDSSVKILKGNNRPIFPQTERAYMLSALSFVDYVVIFKEQTPYNLIKLINPDILVKGADYKKKDIAGSDIVKKTVLIPMIKARSTTRIIKEIEEKINEIAIDKSWTLFLDRDGVINKKLENDYVKSWSEFVFIDNSLKAIYILKKLFNRIIIITNQRGIGREVMSFNDLELIHKKMLATIKRYNGKIDKIYVCPHDIKANCNCRKPKTGMVNKAKLDFPDINLKKSIIVGDSIRDIEFGKRAGMITVFIGNNDNPKNAANFFYNSLYEFAMDIERKLK